MNNNLSNLNLCWIQLECYHRCTTACSSDCLHYQLKHSYFTAKLSLISFCGMIIEQDMGL